MKIADNIVAVSERIRIAAEKSGRSADDIALVAVSKMKPASMIREAYDAGNMIFGENYAQELRDKANELEDLNIQWHFIGHLQKNKVKYVARAATIFESLDSLDIAAELSKRRKSPIGCLIEVNIADEKSKSGISPKQLVDFFKALQKMPNINPLGLMAIPPFSIQGPESSRPYFRRMKILLDNLNNKLLPDVPMRELSMGMSEDFETAIEEGSTMVRIGTAIFGERACKFKTPKTDSANG